MYIYGIEDSYVRECHSSLIYTTSKLFYQEFSGKKKWVEVVHEIDEPTRSKLELKLEYFEFELHYDLEFEHDYSYSWVREFLNRVHIL